jgi:hypothetical protein
MSPCFARMHGAMRVPSSCAFSHTDANLDVLQWDGDGVARSRSGEEKRLIKLVDFVQASATLHFLPALIVPQAEADLGLPRLASSVLVFELPRSWTWESSDVTAGGAGARTGGLWFDRSARSGMATRLEDLIGPSAMWLGEYKVDRQSGEKLSQVLTSLSTSTAQLLTAFDGEQLVSMIDMRLGAMRSQSEACPLPAGTGSGSSKRTRDEQAAAAAEASKLLSVQIVADCIELHSGVVRTDEGVIFHLNYRLNLTKPQGTNHLFGE